MAFDLPITEPSPSETPSTRAPSRSIGEVRFLRREEAIRLRGALEAARLLVVTIPDLGPGARGRLAEVLDDAIEGALRSRGGAPPGIGATCDRDAALSDQLYRARKVGREGLAIELGSMGGIVDPRRTLDPDDAELLRFLVEATRERPVVLLLDGADTEIRAHGAPKALPEALAIAAPTKVIATPREVPPSPRVYVSVAPAEAPPIALGGAVARLTEVSRTTPLGALERAFVEGYAPLRAALLAGALPETGRGGLIGLAEARTLCTSFSTTFARAYAEALPTFAITGRHPRMVFELFEIAQRCARIHGARSTHVVIVDSLRWDLSRAVRERLARDLVRQAVCVEEHVLWSVLPTTTSVQLDAIVRGEDALRAPIRPETETAIVRGRSLDVLRRMRLGHRDLVKLDLLEGRLRESGPAEGPRLAALADELAPILARYVASSKPRALIVVAGDHGFTFGGPDAHHDERQPTSGARQGGASPDEVFVPFQAWLVGGVH
jgi:hypothetical protein